MHDQPIRGHRDLGCPQFNHDQDLRHQAVVLIHVLTLYPASLRPAELLCEVSGGSADFSEEDRLERAIRDLAGVGLLARNGELVLPTRALRFDAIVRVGV